MAFSLLCAPLVHRAAPFSLIVKSITTPHYKSLSIAGLLPKQYVNGVPSTSVRFSSGAAGVGRAVAGKKVVKQGIDIYVGSPEQLVQPYLPPLRHPSIFTLRGLKSRWAGMKSTVMNFIASIQIKDSLKKSQEKWNKRAFLALAANYYKDINSAIAKHDSQQLRNLLTDGMYKRIGQLGLLQTSGPALKWECNISTPKILTMRYARMSTGTKNVDFAQITVQFQGSQTLSLQGGNEKSAPIHEYWVFERSLLQKESKWRLCHQSSPLVAANT